VVPPAAHGARVGGRIGDGLLERAQELLGDLPLVETGEPAPTKPYEGGRVRVFTKQSDQAHVVSACPSYPLEHPDRYALQGSLDRARRRHVVAPLHRGAKSGAGSRLLRLRDEPQLH